METSEMTKQQLQKILGAQLKQMRKTHDMSQVELAKKLKISLFRVFTIERGLALPDLWTARCIAKTFDRNFQFHRFLAEEGWVW